MKRDIDKLTKAWDGSSSTKLAQQEGVMPSTMRSYFRDYGVTSPNRKRTQERRALVAKLWGRGTVEEIATYLTTKFKLEVSMSLVRMDALRLGLTKRVRTWVQLVLWPADAFKVEARPMRIVHVKQVVACSNCNQLSLFPELFNDQQKAA